MGNKGISRNKGETNPFFGRKHTPEELEKMSLAHLGKKRPPFSKEWRQHMSEGKKGKYAGKSNPFYGKKHSEETKLLIGQKGRDRIMPCGENHPNWQGGITNPRKSGEEKRWSISVRRRDKFICQQCGIKSTRENPVEAHHIRSFAKCSEGRFDISNGIALCLPCHLLTDTYGGKNNVKVN